MFPKADFPLTINQLKNTIKDRFDSTVVLFNNEVVGFANFYEVRESQYCAIGNVIVSPCFRNRGVGTFLINAMEDIGKRNIMYRSFICLVLMLIRVGFCYILN